MTRAGLAGEVPGPELCRDMAAIPALAEAFKETCFVWCGDGYPTLREAVDGEDGLLPAPTVRGMLAWLDRNDWWRLVATAHGEVRRPAKDEMLGKAYDPDALARACIEAAKEQP